VVLEDQSVGVCFTVVLPMNTPSVQPRLFKSGVRRGSCHRSFMRALKSCANMSRPSGIPLALPLSVWLLISPAIATAQDPPAPPAPAPKAIVSEVLKDFGALASRRTWTILGIGGGAALAVHPADRYVNRQVGGSDYGFLRPGGVVGNIGIQLGSAAGVYLIGYGIAGRNSAAARVGAEVVRSQLVTQALTFGLKASVRRERPDGQGGLSFPSGHASTTFATATVLASHFGWRVAVPGYLVATYVASSRLHENRHNASDVIFGAAVGVAVGQTIRARREPSVAIQPFVFPGGAGVGVEW
jgi:membrane-associated phospholipid phosphatase